MDKRTCTIDGCGRKYRAKGLCSSHYNARFGHRPKPRPVECTVCGKTVMKAQKEKGRRVVCSTDCRTILTWGRPKAPEPPPKPKPPRTTVAPVNVIKATRLLWVGGDCDWCGARFMKRTSSSIPRCCSDRCSRKWHDAKRYRARGRFQPTRKQRLELYERDNWTCQICTEPVDRDAHYLDAWAPSLDHIVPQSHQLIPDHSPEALRTAHRWCNSVRGDLTYYTDADLAAV